MKEKIPLLGRNVENAPGFLISALEEDYQLLPGRKQQKSRTELKQKKPKSRESSQEKRDRDYVKAVKALYMN